jgi:hypothetical protein
MLVEDREYRPELATFELVAEVRRLLAAERSAERLVCRYLADLADRVQRGNDAELQRFVDEFQAARAYFGLGARETRERVRVGRALRRVPSVERAFVSGDLSYSRVREITRVATPDNESKWLELAQKLDMRSLERRVAGVARSSTLERTRAVEPRADDLAQGEAPDADEPSGEPAEPKRRSDAHPAPARARTEWTSHDSLRVTFELSAEAWALLERALDAERRRVSASLSDAEALEALARDALAAEPPSDERSTDASPGSHPRASDEVTDEDRELPAWHCTDEGDRDEALSTAAIHCEARPKVGLSEKRFSDEPISQLLRQIMGRRRGWTVDDLCDQTGLEVQYVVSSLLYLELDGLVRQRSSFYDPT